MDEGSSSHRILVVDDSLTIRRALELILRRRGYTLDFAADGREALDRANAARPDLILLDYVLPDMRGPDVCVALAARPSTMHTPIVLVSAKGASIRQAYREAQNVVSYITKPFKPQTVLSVVENALKNLRTAVEASPPAGLEAPSPATAPVSLPSEGSFPVIRRATIEETFDMLLGQLEGAAATRAGRRPSAGREGDGPIDTIPRSIGELLLDTRKHLQRIEQHLEDGSLSPYRLRPDGSFANIASILLEAHSVLCEAALALAAGGAPSDQLPGPPRVLLASTPMHPWRDELDRQARGHGAAGEVLLVDREPTSLPWLVTLLRPSLLVATPGRDEELDRALRITLACLPQGTRVVLCLTEGASSAEDWSRLAQCISAPNELEALLADPKSSTETAFPEATSLALEVVAL
jgi:CheY-like chemotaxis protein